MPSHLFDKGSSEYNGSNVGWARFPSPFPDLDSGQYTALEGLLGLPDEVTLGPRPHVGDFGMELLEKGGAE